MTKEWIVGGDNFNTLGDTAATYCSELSLDGGGWRLPSIYELASIVDTNYTNRTINPVFMNIVSAYYWSSTTYQDNTIDAWGFFFHTGNQYHFEKWIDNYVRCVRSVQ